MPSCSTVIERAKPLLGTFINVRVRGLEAAAANLAISRCFAEIARIHALMSFQEKDSDVSRLNRDAHRHAVHVDERTYQVLELAAGVSKYSEGTFDITVAPATVAATRYQADPSLPRADAQARWSDIQLLPDQHVAFARPLWIDVSGIAKGYAVDAAMKILAAMQPLQACINAGGDLAIRGDEAERIKLGNSIGGETMVPVVQLRNGSMASSDARHGAAGVHVDGATRRPAPGRLVTVLAQSCAVADALTKVVMASGSDAHDVLRHFEATAIMSVGVDEWLEVA